MPKCNLGVLHGCSPVNLLHIFTTLFLKNTSGRLLLRIFYYGKVETKIFYFQMFLFLQNQGHSECFLLQ